MTSTETYRIERTISTGNTDKFSEAICAFSNDLPGSHKNGYLIIGAEDDGSIKLIPSQTEFNKLLQYCSVPRTMPEILSFMGYSDRTKFRNKYLKPLLDEGKLEMTDPEHPRSSIQKYKAV